MPKKPVPESSAPAEPTTQVATGALLWPIWAALACALLISAVFVTVGVNQAVAAANLRIVPDVAGMSLDAATETLGDLNLRYTPVRDVAAELAANEHLIVEEQSPAAGTVATRGERVKLMLHPIDLKVPNVVGLTVDKARAVLESAGFGARPDIVVPAAGNSWMVDSQSIRKGTSAPAGSHVIVTVEIPLVPVPSFIGLTKPAAQELISDLGLILGTDPERPPQDWTVATQDPAPGTEVKYGSTVTGEFQAPPPPEIVFSVTGNGSAALITWVAPGSFTISQDTNAAVPWSVSFPYRGASQRGNFSAQMLDGDSITCTMTVGGKVVKEATSSGAYAIVMCG